MLGSVTLEIAIGIIFIFFLVSIICSTLREGIEAWFKSRAAYLEHGIRQLLSDKTGNDLAKRIYEHPLISSLYHGEYTPGKDKPRPDHLASGKNLPSYIPSRNFALALMDIAARGPKTDAISSDPAAPVISLDTVRANILNIHNEKVQRVMLTSIDNAQGDLKLLQKNIENWFDSTMDRVSGWYRRSTQWIMFWIGLIVAVAMNIDTIGLVNYLSRNDTARKLLVARAETVARDSAVLKQNYSEVKTELEQLRLPIGWNAKSEAAEEDNDTAVSVPMKLLGWLITAIAATLGAPFWFDLLNKIMVIRSTVKPHEKSPEEGSEDRKSQKASPDMTFVAVPAGLTAPAASAALQPAVYSTPVISSVRDEQSSIDACEAAASGTETIDEHLPPAEGGVA